MSESGDIFISPPSYSPIPATQTLRQNVLNCLQRERPNSFYSLISPPISLCQSVQRERPFQFEDRLYNSATNKINKKRRGNEIMYSYVKKSVKGPKRKIICIQIFDAEEFNGSKLCECKAVCAQHIVENVISDDIYRPRSRRVQAQRKFAQGAYVPPNVVPVAAVQENRRDAPQDANRNVTINHMSPRYFLDVVSMQGTHTHLEPVVLVEKMGGRSVTRDMPHTTEVQGNVEHHKPSAPLKPKRTRKVYKQEHVMCLRSKKKVLVTNKTKKVAKRKAPVEMAKPKPKKKTVVRARKHTAPSTEFSLEDIKPLTYFASCHMPNRTAMKPNIMVHVNVASPEPVAGPSGLQRSGSSTSNSYYNSKHNIHRWMNDSITQRAHQLEQSPKTKKSKSNQSKPSTSMPSTSMQDIRLPTVMPRISVSSTLEPLLYEGSVNDDSRKASDAGIVTENAAENDVPSRTAQRQAQIALEARTQEEQRLRAILRKEVVDELRMRVEVDGMAKVLENEKDAKRMDVGPSSEIEAETLCAGSFVDAPVFRPTQEEFTDPIEYVEQIWSEASRFGVCKIIPPEGWKPTCKVTDDIQFKVTNQYISRLYSRWGAAARELCAIKLCLQQQKVNITRVPLLDGIEVNLPKLYHLVQRHGGLETVINKKKWGKVADEMKINKTPTTERKLDQIYVKYLLPYDTLAHHERQDIMRKVEKAWQKKNQKLLDRALNPLHRQKRMLGLSDTSDEEAEDHNTSFALNEAEDCIIQGPFMNRAKFKRVATNAYDYVFGQGFEASTPDSLSKIEEVYWRHVLLGTEHICVHTAAIDTGEEGHGFTKNKNDPYGNHPWNLKMLSQHPRNVLRYLGPALGVTVPTLHLGMLFSTSCWHKDPHTLPWMEFQHVGPSRIWYGIPDEQSDKFRKAVETLCPTSCQNKSLWLASEISMIPPNTLCQHNVPLSRVTQEKGEFILVVSKAYTCSISTGYTESESVYFATPSWLDNLPEVFYEAHESCEPTMFSMEQLLVLMGKDPRTEKSLLEKIQPIYDKMLRDEVNNRQILQEKGIKFIHETAINPRRKRQSSTWNARDHEECEFCRKSLFLSKVSGVTSRSSSLCLEHALRLLDTDAYRNRKLDLIEVHVFVTATELNSVADNMKLRISSPA